jgi:uncharacterized protein YjdB
MVAIAVLGTVSAADQQGITLLHNLPSDTLSCGDVLVVTVVSSTPGYVLDWENLDWFYDKKILELTKVEEESGTVWEFRPLAADTFAAIFVSDVRYPEEVYGVLHFEIRPVRVTGINVLDDKKEQSATIAVGGSPLPLTVKVTTICPNVEIIGQMKVDRWIIEPKDWNKGAGIEFIDNNATAPERSIRAKADGYDIDSTRVIVVYRQEPTETYPVPVYFKDTFYVSVPPNYVSKVTLRDKNGNTGSSIGHDGSVTLRATVEPSNATDNSVDWEYDRTLLKAVRSTGDNTYIFSPCEGVRGITTTISARASLPLPSTTVKADYTLRIAPILVTGLTLTDENGKTDTTIPRHGTITLTAKVKPDNAFNPNLSWEIPQGLDVIAAVQENGRCVIQPIKSDTTIKIRVKALDESGIEAVYTIKVLPVKAAVVELVDFDGGTSSTVNRKDTVFLTATVFPVDAIDKELVWNIIPDDGIAEFVSVKGSGNTNGVSRGVVIRQGNASIEVKVHVSTNPEIKASYYISSLPVSVNSLSLSRWSKDTIQRGERLTLYADLAPSDAADRRVEWSYSPSDAVKFVDVSEDLPYERTIEALLPNTDVKITVQTPDGIFVDRRLIHIERIHLEGINLQRMDEDVTSVRSMLRSTEDCYLEVMIVPEDVSNPEVSWKAEGDVVITLSKSDPLRCFVAPKCSNTEGSVTVTVKTDGGEQKEAKHTFVVPLDGISLTDISGKTDSIVDLEKASLPIIVELVPHLLQTPASFISQKEDYNSSLDWEILTPEYAYFDEGADAAIFPHKRLRVFEEITGGNIRVRLSATDGSGWKAMYTLTVKPVGVQSLTIKDKQGLSASTVEKGDTIELTADYTPTSILHPELEWSISPAEVAEFVDRVPAYDERECAVRILQPDTKVTVTVQSLDGGKVKASYVIDVKAQSSPPLWIDAALPSGTEPCVFYRQGILYLRYAEGYLCHISTLTGRLVTFFHELASESTHPLQLPSGVYVFTIENGSRKYVFKFIAD